MPKKKSRRPARRATAQARAKARAATRKRATAHKSTQSTHAQPTPSWDYKLRQKLRATVLPSSILVGMCVGICLFVILTAYRNSVAPEHTDSPSTQTVSKHTPNKTVLPPQAPVSLECPKGSVLTIVAHEDDDILFMNPSIQEAIDSGACIYTVFVTAGDAGSGSQYWEGRERGADAAYRTMLGTTETWQQVPTKLMEREIHTLTLPGSPKVALVFLRLPDGNTTGQGFASTSHESLHKLRGGEIVAMHTVDSGSEYTQSQLVEILGSIITLYKPTLINAQASAPHLSGGDHSDHQTVGYLTVQAAQKYAAHVPIRQYAGYQSGAMPSNLTDAQIADKRAAFGAYEAHDTAICAAASNCFGSATYEAYMSRQYEQSAIKP